MSHPFCNTPHCESGIRWPDIGWANWNGKAIYIHTEINDSVLHPQAAGEAITRWNDAVGSRFLLTPDGGQVSLTLLERNENEWPFTEWLLNGKVAGGFCLNYDQQGQLLGTNPGQVSRALVYVNREGGGGKYHTWASIFAHEIGHAFGLNDHPQDDINSIMSYQWQGRLLLGPSAEDVEGITRLYELKAMDVTPQELEGIEQVESIWWYDRYGLEHGYKLNKRDRWRLWNRQRDLVDLSSLIPYETYRIRPKEEGVVVRLGYGRFISAALPPLYRWMYL